VHPPPQREGTQDSDFLKEKQKEEIGMRNRLKISTQRSKSRDGPAEETPKEEPSKEEAPVGDLPKEEPFQEEAPREEPPAEETPMAEAPQEAAPKEVTPKEDSPAEDSPKGESLGDAAAVATAAQRKKSKKKVLWFFIKLASVCLVIWIIFTFVFGIGIMNGETMYPRLRDGDLYLYYRLDSSYIIDDVVTFQIDGSRSAARVVAMGGDVVDISEQGQLIVNGNVKDEEIFYVTEKTITTEIDFPYTVPENSYFVLGDFRTSSVDSRAYGALSRSDIDGKILSFLRVRGI
jgi:signal peptidase I